MKLLTKKLEKLFPPLGGQENNDDPVVYAKFFTPFGGASWYATEYSPEERIFFGYVSLFGDHNDEWGYFSLNEFEGLKRAVERDLYCGIRPISQFNIKSLCQKK